MSDQSTNNVQVAALPKSFDELLDAAWDELRQLFNDSLSSELDFDTYLERNLGPVLDASLSGVAPETPAQMRDRQLGSGVDKINPEGALLRASLAASAADLLEHHSHLEARWAYLTEAMYWLGHAKIAFMIDTLRDAGLEGKLRERSLQGTDKRWAWSRERRDLILSFAEKRAGARGRRRPASQIAPDVKKDLDAEISTRAASDSSYGSTRTTLSQGRVRAILEQAGYAVEKRQRK